MNERGKRWVFGAAMAVILASCFDPPEYSNTPAIEFESVSFVDVSSPSDPDSLILAVRFKDGDGDLGLDANDPLDTLYPYQNRTFFDTIHNSNLGYYYAYKDGPFITYKTYRNPATRSGWKPKLMYDTLPEFKKPYNCVNWEVITFGNELDTFYFEKNPDHYNIFVQFMVKNNNGVFEEFKWTEEFSYPQCGITFDGRFPVLSKDLSRKAALDGRIRYAMASAGFLVLFNVKTLMLRVTIQDRLLNRSNTVETQEFTLQQIKKKG